MNFCWELGNDKQNYVVCISVSHDNGKITRKDFKIITTFTVDGMVKYCRDVDFEEMDTECSTGKNYGFWVLWGIFKEYIKQNIIMAVLRKANSHSVVISRLIKKSIM